MPNVSRTAMFASGLEEESVGVGAHAVLHCTVLDGRHASPIEMPAVSLIARK